MARRLAETGIDGVRILEHRAEASALLPYLAGAARAFLVDASVSGHEPGTIHRFDVSEAPLPMSAQTPLSHGLGLGEAIELARALGELPGECVVFAIEAGQYEAGQALTPEVEAAIDRLTARLLADLSMRGGQPPARQ